MFYTCHVLSCPTCSLTVFYICPVLSCPTCRLTMFYTCPVLFYLPSYYVVYLSRLVLSYLPILLRCIPVPSCPVLPAYLTVLYTCPVLSCPTCLSYRAAYLSRLDNTTLLAPHLVRAQDAYKDIIILPILDLYHTASISLRPSLCRVSD